jgi:hypothetical protein
MLLLGRLRRSPWLAGALLLVLAASLVASTACLIGSRHWSLYAGLLAIVLLLFGAVERLWHSVEGLWQRRSFGRTRAADRSRFRVVPGGKGKGKGNGHARDAGEGHADDDGDGPRWVM